MLGGMGSPSLSRLLPAWVGCLFILAGMAPARSEPPAPAKELPLAEALTASGFKSFAGILTASGLLGELGESAYTCFAPTDEAIAAMPAADLKDLRDNPKSESTRRWIKYHFIKSEVCRKADLGIVREIITWSGLPSYLSITPSKMSLNGGSVLVGFDLPAKHGILHGLSKALDPRDHDRPEDGVR